MRTFTFTVDDTFEIEDRGIIVVPGLNIDDDPNVLGDPLTIVRPDGTSLESHVSGISMINTVHRKCLPIMLPKSIGKSDVPTGSTITITETRRRDANPNHSAYNIGDHVSISQNYRNNTPRSGTIERKLWHHKYRLWNYYIVDDDGKSVSKRYLANDFSLPENAE